MKTLPLSFYNKDTLILAKELLGKIVCVEHNGDVLSGIIVETEADLWDVLLHKCCKCKERNRRKIVKNDRLLAGPGCLTMGLGIDFKQNNQSLRSKLIAIKEDDFIIREKDNVQTTRIGITQAVDLPYRFYIKSNKHVSKW